MQLSFSTLACPGWSLDQILQAAPRFGYQGVEIRGLGEDLDLRESPDFRPSRIRATRRSFQDAGLSICGLGSSAAFADPDRRADAMDEARAYIGLAADVGCGLVRIFGGEPGADESWYSDMRAMADCLRALADEAQSAGVRIVLETHDSFSTGSRVSQVLSTVNHPAAGALWDVYHPFREGESPEATWKCLAPFLLHVHVKDSRDGRYCLLGEGEVPVAVILQDLMGLNSTLPPRDGAASDRPATTSIGQFWLSVEWEKRWYPDLEEPDIVLPQYAGVLREILGTNR